MPNRTEQLSLELGRNDRWQDKDKEGFSQPSRLARYHIRRGRPLRGKRIYSPDEIKTTKRLGSAAKSFSC